jgi:glyoxylate/hydroxypyruvate reductase A
MALLIDIRQPEWMTEEQFRDDLAPHLPGVDIYCSLDEARPEEVIMLAAARLNPGVAQQLPKLQLVQKLGAGVETMVNDPDLGSNVRIARLKPDAPAREIAEYCIAYVLREQRNMTFHDEQAAKGLWTPVAPRQVAKTTIGVLGLGHIGGRTARMFTALGYRVIGWSRSAKEIDGVECRNGPEGLVSLLAECDHVCCILPSTHETRGMFNAGLLAKMKPGAMIINAGRGDLIVEDDLLAALDAGTPGKAVLDVVNTEPLPSDSPLWHHPALTVTPHVSGWHLDDSTKVVAENYRRLLAGDRLLNEVDRAAGY